VGVSEPFHTASVDGVTLAYNDEGAGDAIVCLHAIGHGARDFEAFRARMKSRFRVVTLDWPGHGRSSEDEEPPSSNRFADLLEGFLDHVGIERAVLIGNSVGGGAAIRFTSRQPGRVRALVLENPAGLDPPDLVAKAGIATLVRMFRAGEEGAAWFRPAFEAYYRLVLPSGPALAQRARILASATDIAPLLVKAWESFAHAEQDLRHLAPTITRPTLFAWAIRDRFVQLKRNRAAISQFLDGRIETFAAGHSPHLETPDEFCASFDRFLAEIERRERAD
jgi:4,5:9,10-diseco-3-hydroxy-5,9,17-trioxoandrosta-1(10),2-diene-4-oate hydrolase